MMFDEKETIKQRLLKYALIAHAMEALAATCWPPMLAEHVRSGNQRD
jgi:hypothetical protein